MFPHLCFSYYCRSSLCSVCFVLHNSYLSMQYLFIMTYTLYSTHCRKNAFVFYQHKGKANNSKRGGATPKVTALLFLMC